MFKPSLKSIWSLAGLAILSIILYSIAQNSYSEIKVDGYELKVEAAKHMRACMNVLKEETLRRGYEIDEVNDPNKTGLIGLSGSKITTSRGVLEDKLAGLNPNYAAVMIDMLRANRVNSGDYIAVGLTAANPGLNLALYSAIQTLDINPIIVTSVGSSMFGANRDDFTWLDMEDILYEKNLIGFKSSAASIGGGNDTGRGLSNEGREIITSNIKKHGVIFINEPSLNENVDKRMRVYTRLLPEDKKYKTFVNIGGGLGNVGSSVNASLIRDGVNRKIGERDFSTEGAIMRFAKRNIPVIHVFRPRALAERYGIETEPIPMTEPGVGEAFVTVKNNLTVAIVCLTILVLSIVAVIIFDRHDRHFKTNIVDTGQEFL
ncbi:MAG: poly-gamma-glutamate system protein [Candidatus Cloacimonas sp.]